MTVANTNAVDVDAFTMQLRRTVQTVRNAHVRGVIGRLSTSGAGHVYFELSGKNGRLSCVAWSTTARVLEIASGEAIVSIQHVDYYAPFGRLQAIVSNVETVTDATWSSAKDTVLERLDAEGVVRRLRRPIPELVRHLCIVTSIGSAAYHDMRRSVEERWPELRVTVVDSLVQGEQAPSRLVLALQAADALRPCVIICGRGGGSETDLAAFDDERVARAMVACTTPVISAVGHESDHSVCDAVADYRAKTPTAAVELALVKSSVERHDELRLLREALVCAMSHNLRERDERRRTCHETLRGLLRKTVRADADRHAMMRTMLTVQVKGRLSAAQQSLAHGRVRLKEGLREHVRRRAEWSTVTRKALRNEALIACKRWRGHVAQSRFDLLKSSPYPAPGAAAAYKRGKRVLSVTELEEDDQIRIQLPDGDVIAVVKRCRMS